MRPFKIDQAPGKDLIADIAASPKLETLKAFLDVRMPWCRGRPLVHDGLVTYGAFEDLLKALSSEACFSLLSPVTCHAASVDDRSFHCVLSLLPGLIPSEPGYLRPPEFSDLLLRIRLRSERLSVLPNLGGAWNGLASAQRRLKREGDFLSGYTPAQLWVEGEPWKRFFPFPLVKYPGDPYAKCTINWKILEDRIQSITRYADLSSRKLIYYTKIKDSQYWVWHLNIENKPSKRLTAVFVRQGADGTHEIGRIVQPHYYPSDSPLDPEYISRKLLEFEFTPYNSPLDNSHRTHPTTKLKRDPPDTRARS